MANKPLEQIILNGFKFIGLLVKIVFVLCLVIVNLVLKGLAAMMKVSQ